MSATQQFRTQHQEILALAGEIGGLALPLVKTGAESQIKAKLNALSGVLSVHLAMEDKSLYPALIGSTNAAAKNTATLFRDQMGGIAAAYKAFAS